MDGTFKDHETGYYTVQNIAEIPDFDQDQYGNTWYNVKFQGGAETFMWLAKNPPEEGKKYYGHLEPTKSGKRLRFKTDKIPEGSSSSSAGNDKYKPKDEKQITRNMVWKNLLGHYDVQSMEPDTDQWKHFWGMVDLHTEMLLPQKITPELVKKVFKDEKPDLPEEY